MIRYLVALATHVDDACVAANNCISVLLTHLGVEALSCAENLLPYVSMQAFYNRLSSKPFLLAFFNLVHKVGLRVSCHGGFGTEYTLTDW